MRCLGLWAKRAFRYNCLRLNLKRCKGKGKLDPHRSFLIELIDRDGDMTMPEPAAALAAATGVQAHPDAPGRFLRKLGVTCKYTCKYSLTTCFRVCCQAVRC